MNGIDRSLNVEELCQKPQKQEWIYISFFFVTFGVVSGILVFEIFGNFPSEVKTIVFNPC